VREVLYIAQTFQTEGVSITKLDCLNRGDRCMVDDESLPLPRRSRDTEKVTDQNAVSSGVSEKSEPFSWFINVPVRQFGL
jgi:hypothetical protein